MTRPATVVRFGVFEFDMEALELRCDGQAVHLQPQPARLLAALLSRPGRLITREELRREIWDDCSVEFDAGLNFAIRKVRRALLDDAEDPSYIETLPRRGYRFIAAVSRPAADGGGADPATGRVAPAAASWRLPRGAAWLAVVTVTVGAVVTFALPAWNDAGSGAAADPRLTLVVLPLEQIGGDERMAMFSRGLMEDLITELAMLSPPRLEVIAPSSALRFDTPSTGNDELRRRLGVDYVVRGAVRSAGGGHRVTVRLESTSSDSPVWAQAFDARESDEVAVQGRIARGLAEALSVRALGASRTPREEDLPASLREAWLEARWLVERSGRAEIERALARIGDVTAAAPGFAPAFALEARGRLRLGDLDAAEAAARTAVRLDPGGAEGHYQLGNVMMGRLRFRDALVSYRQATEQAPGIARYRLSLAQLLGNLRRFDEALRHLELARVLDPVSTTVDFDMGIVYIASGRPGRAVEHCTRSLDLLPYRAGGYHCLLAAHHFDGKPDLAAEAAAAIMEIDGAGSDELAAFRAAAPETAVRRYFEWELSRIEAANPGGGGGYRVAQVQGALGRRDAALAAIREVVEARSFQVMWLAKEPWFAFLRGDPEYESILRRVGLILP